MSKLSCLWSLSITFTCTIALLGTPAQADLIGVDIGSPSISGSVTTGVDTATVVGGGDALWLSSDAFFFAYELIDGDATVTVRLASYVNIQTYTKGGIMFRESLDANAMNAFCGMRGSSNSTFQRRTSTGGGTSETKVGASIPRWLRLVRSGDDFSAYHSDDGVTWTQIGSTETIAMSDEVYVGLALSAGNDTAAVTANFDNISGLNLAPPNVAPTADAGADQTVTDTDNGGDEAVTLDGSASSDSDGSIVSYDWEENASQIASGVSPSVTLAVGVHTIDLTVTDDDSDVDTDSVVITVEAPAALALTGVDIGSPSISGSVTTGLDTATVIGGGERLWSSSDAFHFAYTQIDGDATVTARLASYTNIQTYTKGGIMFRESLDANSMNAFCGMRGGSQSTFQRRVTTGATTNETRVSGGTPQWLRLVRSGDDFSAYGSSDGFTWTQIGSTVTIAMSDEVYVGLALSAGNDTAAVTADFDNIDGLGGSTPPANVAPTADAGVDQTVNDADDSGDESITLDGSGSSDSDGTIASYDWEENVSLIATGVSPTVTMAVGAHTIDLTVTDDDGATDIDSVVITVTEYVNIAPIANAGADQTVNDADDSGDESITLDGSGSVDSDGTIASYDWQENSSTIATGVSPTVTIAVGVHTIDLVVTDDDGATGTDSVVITVTEYVNLNPTADAGADQTVNDADDSGDESITLDGSGSSDSDGTIASYVWEENSSQIATGVNPSATLAVGVHTVDLTVTDDDGATASDSVVITVTAYVNLAPTADAGADQTLTDTDSSGDEAVTLDGSASTDSDGTIATYIWSDASGQIGTGISPTVTMAVGTTTVTLEVTDDDGATDTDTVDITVEAMSVFSLTGVDIGSPSISGSVSTGTDTATIVGGGDSLWSSSDAFYFAYKMIDGNATVTARLASYTNIQTYTKGGIMFRESLDANSMNAFCGMRGGSQSTFQRRVTTGATTNETRVSGGTPQWLRLVRSGDDFSAYSSSDGVTWTQIGSTVTIAMSDEVYVGLALSAGNDTAAVTADFDNIDGLGSAPANVAPIADAGADQTVDDLDDSGDEAITLDGAASTDSDGTIVSYVWEENSSQIATGATPSVTLAVGAHTIDLTVTDDGSATDTDSVTITVNAYVNVAPTANAGADQTVTDTDDGGDEAVTLDGSASTDSDGTIASYIWEENFSQIATGATPSVTLAVGVHTIDLTVTDDDGATDTDSVTVTVEAPAGLVLTGIDIGSPSISGSVTTGLDTATVVGGGDSLWSWADAFYFAYTQINGDADVIVRLASYVNIQTYTKGGIMFRESLDANAMNAFCGMRGGSNSTFQRRTSTGGSTAETRVSGGTPQWLRLVRSGDDFSAYSSTDGVTWTQIGSTETIAMSDQVCVGLAVSAGNDTAAVTANFDNISGLVGTAPANQAPTADAGADQTVTDTDGGGDEAVTLDGSASTDSDGTIASYVWEENSSQIATGVTPSVTLAVGSHTIDLTVTDNDGATDTDSVVITVNAPAGNVAPTADAGANQMVTDSDGGGDEAVTLDGSGSTDTDGTITSYVWDENASQIATGVSPSVTLAVGSHTIDLTVTDNDGATDSDSVTITVNASSTAPAPTVQTISEYKGGISLDVQGTYGTDYLVEQWYHDQKIDARCTIYINDDVDMDLFHNAANINLVGDSFPDYILIGADGLDGIPDSGDEGVIRYRGDQEMTRRAMWSQSTALYPAWPGVQSFADMEYDPGVSVVGSTGPLPGGDITDPSTFYWRGMIDSVGDEWHIIAVGDDDDGLQSYYANTSSDGKIYYFVVNPTTPACQIITNDASAQFYTTPPKTYFVPVIRDQTSYLLGDCDIELAALGGAAVEYSMVAEGQNDSWQTYTAPINTITAGLQSDTRYALKYRIGSTGPAKTRTIHFDPGYPSDGEVHPKDILWTNGATGIQAVRDRLTSEPYLTEYNRAQDKDDMSNLYHGNRWAGGETLANAFLLLMDGFNQHPTNAECLRMALLDSYLNLDPIGLEGIWSLNSPTREINRQGYWSAGPPYKIAMAYDWVITDFRAGLVPYGLTAVEDYKIRDNIAAYCNWTAYTYSKSNNPRDVNGYAIGMWHGAWTHGAAMAAAVINNYDNDLYGTSGAPGGVYSAPRAWTPYPDYPKTWWNVFNDKNATLEGYPNQDMGSTFWGLLNENEEWADRAGYWRLMSGWYYRTCNFRRNFDGYVYTHIESAIKKIAEGGQIMPLKSPEEGALEHYSVLMVNDNFPTIAPVEIQQLNAGSNIYDKNIGFSMYINGVTGIILYDDDWNQ